MSKLVFNIGQPDKLSFGLSTQPSLGFAVPGVAISRGLPEYQGSVDVTPSDDVQVLSTSEHCLHQDIIIEAIPSNYGLITYTGSGIIVS